VSDSVVKVGKPFSDYELICEIQVKNGLDLGENYRTIINGCKTFAANCICIIKSIFKIYKIMGDLSSPF
jgi:hypothetical protein